MTPTHESTLNCDLGLGSQFNVGFWPGVIIQRGILIRGHNSTWNFDPGSEFNVEFWTVYISSTRGIVTQEGVEIQQRDQNSTAKEGHNSTKIHWILTPGRNSMRGSKFYLTPDCKTILSSKLMVSVHLFSIESLVFYGDPYQKVSLSKVKMYMLQE